MNITDGELLRRYSSEQNDSAFEQLVQRYIDLVYSAALRQVNGDAQLAEDVTQSVFTDLARKASKLGHHSSLLGWLYTSTHFAASSVRRQEHRRRVREQEAYAMNSILTGSEPEPDWQQIRPLLDEAMHTLGIEDREAVLLRHFERRSFAEIAERLRLSENAARMKVDRALDKLQAALEKRGVTSTALAMAALMSAHAVGAAPAALAVKVSQRALAGAAVGGVSVLVFKLLTLAKAPIGIAAIVVAATAVIFFSSSRGHSSHAGRVSTATITTNVRSSNATPVVRKETGTDGANVSTSQKPPGQSVLHLTILTKETGEPVSEVKIDYRGWSGRKFKKQTFSSDRVGNCDVLYAPGTTEMELTTRFEGLADTRLLWRKSEGDVIPSDYVLKLDPAVPIGGQVLDPDGNPVAGAKVGWNHSDDPAGPKRPESHDFGWIEVRTDAEGRWEINRMAADVIRRIYGSARDSNFVDSSLVFASRVDGAEKQLTNQMYVFRLGRPVVARGIVVDPSGTPIADAKVIVGWASDSGRREGRTASDGSFSVAGCRPGKEMVTAQAPGFATTTIEAELADGSEPVRLTLQQGKALRLRVVDGRGRPVSKASIWYDNMRTDPTKPAPAQADIHLATDESGRAAWTNAPEGELKLNVSAPGFAVLRGVAVSADDEEHVVTLGSDLIVSGHVRDAKSGALIPHFRIIEGYPSWNPMDNSTNPIWGVFERFQHDFAKGTYQQSFTEPVIGGGPNRGYILKFTADGYAPFVSRVIGPDEGAVDLDVALRPAKDVFVTVYKSDGQLAVGADVGLVEPTSRLSLTGTGFSRRNVQSGGTLLLTDEKGQFKLPADDSISRVIVASPDGYAESTPGALPTNAVMQLQAWGGLDVTCAVGGKPVVGRDYVLQFGGGAMETVDFDYAMARVKTDEQGHFAVDKLPAGKHSLVRIYPFKTARGGGYSFGDKTAFEIRPSETTELNPCASEHVVTGRWHWASTVKSIPSSALFGHLQSGNVPFPPPEVRGNPSALKAFFQTPEYRAAREKMHSYKVTVGEGTLVVEGVQPGSYELTVTALEAGKSTYSSPETGLPVDSKPVAHGSVMVGVPADNNGGEIDAGVVELQLVR